MEQTHKYRIYISGDRIINIVVLVLVVVAVAVVVARKLRQHRRAPADSGNGVLCYWIGDIGAQCIVMAIHNDEQINTTTVQLTDSVPGPVLAVIVSRSSSAQDKTVLLGALASIRQ